MKKIKYLSLLILIAYQVRINASSLLVSCPETAYEGDTITCNISATSDKQISGMDGSITYSNVSLVDKSNLTGVAYFEVKDSGFDGVFDITSSPVSLASYTFTAGSEGTANISVSCNKIVLYDTDLYTDTDCSGDSATITISKKPEKKKENNEKKKETTTVEPVIEKSSNTKLKEFSVKGYSIIKNNDNNYTLMVDNDIEEITIEASTEDEKATIKGLGVKKIVEGDNSFEIVVTAEDGTTNTYNLVVTREKKNDSYVEYTDDEDTKEIVEENNTSIYIISILGITIIIVIILLTFKKKKNKF